MVPKIHGSCENIFSVGARKSVLPLSALWRTVGRWRGDAQHSLQEGRTMSQSSNQGSTMSTGAPAPSDRNSLTIGPNGPILLHDVHFLEQMAHFNREKVPERQPHAKGSGAFGVFETTEDVSRFTRAALFQKG